MFDENTLRPNYECIYRGNDTHSTFEIYPLHHLGRLLQTQPPAAKILFLLDENGEIWFAGRQSKDATREHSMPIHYQMTGLSMKEATCITAGIFELSADNKKIVRMYNKSCSFRPRFDSLKWALATFILNSQILADCGVALAEELILDEYAPNTGGYQGVSYDLTHEMILWIKKFLQLKVSF